MYNLCVLALLKSVSFMHFYVLFFNLGYKFARMKDIAENVPVHLSL